MLNWLFRLVLVVAALVVAAFGYIAYPQWTLSRIWEAAKAGDIAALETFVDWRSVQAGVRADAAREALRQMAPVNTGSVLGVPVGSAGMAESVITADHFSLRVRQGVANRYDFDAINRTLRFTSPTTMVAAFNGPDRPDAVQIVLTLSGLTWRVTRVLVPDNDPSLLTLQQSISPQPKDDPAARR